MFTKVSETMVSMCINCGEMKLLTRPNHRCLAFGDYYGVKINYVLLFEFLCVWLMMSLDYSPMILCVVVMLRLCYVMYCRMLWTSKCFMVGCLILNKQPLLLWFASKNVCGLVVMDALFVTLDFVFFDWWLSWFDDIKKLVWSWQTNRKP
jgi:ribosomal protein L32